MRRRSLQSVPGAWQKSEIEEIQSKKASLPRSLKMFVITTAILGIVSLVLSTVCIFLINTHMHTSSESETSESNKDTSTETGKGIKIAQKR